MGNYNWIIMDKDKVQWLILVNSVICLKFAQNAVSSLTRWRTIISQAGLCCMELAYTSTSNDARSTKYYLQLLFLHNEM
jgi:hypothetical protein